VLSVAIIRQLSIDIPLVIGSIDENGSVIPETAVA